MRPVIATKQKKNAHEHNIVARKPLRARLLVQFYKYVGDVFPLHLSQALESREGS